MARRRSAVGPPCGARGARALARRGVIRYGAARPRGARGRVVERNGSGMDVLDLSECQSMCSKLFYVPRQLLEKLVQKYNKLTIAKNKAQKRRELVQKGLFYRVLCL